MLLNKSKLLPHYWAYLGNENTFTRMPNMMDLFIDHANLGCVRLGRIHPNFSHILDLKNDPIAPLSSDSSQLKLTLSCDDFEGLSAYFLTLDQRLGHTVVKEYLDVTLPELSTPIARAPRWLFRPLGMATQAVRLVRFMDEDPLSFHVGVRSERKRIGAGLFDNIAAGLVAEGETRTQALCREAYEEAGLSLQCDDLVPLGSFPSLRCEDDGVLNESTWLYGVKGKAQPCHNIDGEVSVFKTLSEAQMLQAIRQRKLMPEAACAFLMTLEN